MCFITSLTGTCLPAVGRLLARLWLHVCQDVPGAPDIHAQRRGSSLQRQDAAGHPVDIAGLRPAAPGRARCDAVGSGGPNGTTPEQPVAGNKRHRSQCGLSTAGEGQKWPQLNPFKWRVFQIDLRGRSNWSMDRG